MKTNFKKIGRKIERGLEKGATVGLLAGAATVVTIGGASTFGVTGAVIGGLVVPVAVTAGVIASRKKKKK